MSMGERSGSIHRPRWRDDPSVGRDARPLANAAVGAPTVPASATAGGDLDIARDSDVPISTQLYWQLAYQLAHRGQPGTGVEPAGIDLVGQLPVELGGDRDVRIPGDVEITPGGCHRHGGRRGLRRRRR